MLNLRLIFKEKPLLGFEVRIMFHKETFDSNMNANDAFLSAPAPVLSVSIVETSFAFLVPRADAAAFMMTSIPRVVFHCVLHDVK